MPIHVRVLGAVTVTGPDGSPVHIGGPRAAAVLAAVALAGPEGASTERLVDAVWGGREPASATRTVQAYLARLRSAVPGLLVSRRQAYALAADVVVDSRLARQRLDAARAVLGGDLAGDLAEAERHLREVRRSGLTTERVARAHCVRSPSRLPGRLGRSRPLSTVWDRRHRGARRPGERAADPRRGRRQVAARRGRDPTMRRMVGMATVWVTGSADGIGREAARAMVAAGHRVVLHARSPERAEQALDGVPGAERVLVGDLSSMAQTRDLAGQVGPVDAIVHNAAHLGRGPGPRPVTEDGLELTFAVNVLAPYLLTALAPRPKRLVYFSSQLHTAGATNLTDLAWQRRPYDGGQAYNDSKLYVVALAFAVARRWPEVRSNAVDPGWVRTRMGGPSAAVSVEEGAATAVRLATSDAPETGRYLSQRGGVHPAAERVDFQEAVLDACAAITGTVFPAS